MWFKGGKNAVSIWYVCWGRKDATCHFEGYQTLNGLAHWFAKEAYKEVPVQRVGQMVISKDGIEEKLHWESREEFLKWAKPLVGFKLPDV